VRKSLRMLGLLAGFVAGAAGLIYLRLEDLVLRVQLSSLGRVLGREAPAEVSARILEGVRRNFIDLEGSGIGDESTVIRFHSAYLRFGLALYRALTAEYGPGEETVEKTHRLLWASGARGPYVAFAQLLRFSGDPFEVFATVAGWVNRRFFPPPKWDRRQVEVENGYGFDYHSCPYPGFCLREGAPELARAFCDMDWRMAELLPARVRMVREKTLAEGDDVCDFRYYRVSI
jgi:hypothetical protein